MKLKSIFIFILALQLGSNIFAQSFALIGDFGVHDSSQQPNAQAVANLVDSWNPEFILTVGDNNYPDGASSTIDAAIGQYYSNYIHPYIPFDPSTNYPNNGGPNRFYPTAGNHDYTTPGAAPYFAYFDGIYGSLDVPYYDFVKGDVHFFAMDSNIESKKFGQDQIDWLQNAMQNSSSPWKIVYFHHHVYSSGLHGWNSGNTGRELDYKAWGATAVIGGHEHNYERLKSDCLTYFINGAGGRDLRDVNPPIAESEFLYNLDHGAMKIDASASSITFQFIGVDEGLIDSYTIEKCTNPNGLNYNVVDIDPCAGILDLNFVNCDDGYRLSSAIAINKWNNVTDLTFTSDGDATLVDFEGLWFTRKIILTFSNCTGPDIVEEIDIPVCDDCCPEGSEYNGAHCSYLLNPPFGYTPFIWNNGFYTHHGPGGPGDCPPGTTWNGAHCSYGINYPNGYNSFIWRNNFYVHPDCDIQIENCCPPGSTWDGANCYYGIHIPNGFTGFISDDNGLYAAPNNGLCPPGTTPNVVGCYYGVDITPGLTGFIWNNAFYANEDCGLEDCCPPDSYWDGKVCKTQISWPGYDGYIHPNGKIYLYPVNDVCPPGTTLNTNTNRCVTGVSVPVGYESEFVDGELNVFPDCENCCPEGWTFDGSSCCQTYIYEDGEITIVQGTPTISKDCISYPKYCCPPGFELGINGCELRNNTEDLVYTYFDNTVTICKETESCIAEEKGLIDEGISQEYRFEEVTIAKENALVKVFPNPFESNLNIEIDNASGQLASIEINSMAGQKMFSYAVQEKGMLTFNLQPELNAGIYVLVLNFQTHQEFVKIVKI